MRPNRLIDGFIRIFGDLKVFSRPPVIVYDPGGYRVKGAEVRQVMSRIEPGDLLVRGYRGYLDGWFIPGYFSHVGMYLGKVEASDRALCTGIDEAKERDAEQGGRRDRPDPEELFATGDQMVVHALAEGVLIEDLLNFCRCDYMAVLRLPPTMRAGPHARRTEGLSLEEAIVEERLFSGPPVSRAEVLPLLRRRALSKVGYPYDTTFDFTDFRRLSCTELVYYVARCLSPVLHVVPTTRRVLLMKRTVIQPDDYAEAPALRAVWWSDSVDRERWKDLGRPPEHEGVPPEDVERDDASRLVS